jgi:hypothetical protein
MDVHFTVVPAQIQLSQLPSAVVNLSAKSSWSPEASRDLGELRCLCQLKSRYKASVSLANQQIVFWPCQAPADLWPSGLADTPANLLASGAVRLDG